MSNTFSDEDCDKKGLQPIDGPYEYSVQNNLKRNEANKRELYKQLFSGFGRSTPKKSLRLIRFIY